MAADLGSPESAPASRERVVVGGLVAHNEERCVARAVRSLLDQELPAGYRWGTIWVVASGCTDGTVAAARMAAAGDPRLRIVEEPERRGKAHAVLEVARRAEGDALVLLNGDAAAEPGAVRSLLLAASGRAAPFAIMARPIPGRSFPGPLAGAIGLLWDLHHEMHLELAAGTHLADELLLVSLPLPPPALRPGVVNDGAFLGVWLTLHGGSTTYSPDARVRIEVPRRLVDHLRQRRRILFGHNQVARELGVAPRTLSTLAREQPERALRVLRRGLRAGGRRFADLLVLATGEALAVALATWDRIVGSTDHVRWARIAPPAPAPTRPPPIPASGGSTEAQRRARALLAVAREFGTGIPATQLASLLPADSPIVPDELLRWLARDDATVRLEGGALFAGDSPPVRLDERRARAVRYRAHAAELWTRHLAPVRRWVLCAGITGSTAYGEPSAGDDLDFFVVTSPGSMWLFLAYTYLAVRFGFRPDPRRERPIPCFNYVLEDQEAFRDFSTARGFLFAREALTTDLLHGSQYYGALLGSASWLSAELPRLVAVRSDGPTRRPAPAAPVGVRLANAAVYLPLAAYLQLVGLRRNARAPDGRFRTRTMFRRLAFASDRFDRLRATLDSPSSPSPPMPLTTAPPEGGVSAASRAPSAR